MEFSQATVPASCLEITTLRLSLQGATQPCPAPPPTCSLRDEAYYTSLPKAVKEATEDALVRPAIWVSDQYVYITTGCLPPSVGTTRHTQQPRVESLS